MRLMTCARIERSSAETGSSATTSLGERASARAMPILCRWPPLNSCGYLVSADSGKPTVVSDPEGPIAAIYRDIARKVAARIARASEDRSGMFPKIVIQNN